MGEPYDIVFLGGGPAGYQGAIRAAQLGARVAVVERDQLGGVCLNQGCIPTKTVRASAEVARHLRRAGEYGLRPVEVVPEMAAIIARKERIVARLRGSIERLFAAQKIDLLAGTGRFLSPRSLEVCGATGVQRVETHRAVVTTGSRPAWLPHLPRAPRILTPDEMLTTPLLPGRLLVVGGGAVGVEMASIFCELGAEVVLIEARAQLLPGEDAEAVARLHGALQRRKIKVLCGTTVAAVTEADGGLRARLADGTELAVDTILLAVGRQRRTDGLGLEELGVEITAGRIVVDDYLESRVPGLYAAGDVIGDWLLAHVAFAEGIRAAENALGHAAPMDYRAVPRCVFSLPEYAAVGLSEEEARQRSSVKVATFPFKSLGMAQALGELEGLVKIIVDAESDAILGAQIVGAHAADTIAELALAMQAGLPARTVMATIHSHPTLGEAVLEVAQALHGQAIHLPPAGYRP